MIHPDPLNSWVLQEICNQANRFGEDDSGVFWETLELNVSEEKYSRVSGVQRYCYNNYKYDKLHCCNFNDDSLSF